MSNDRLVSRANLSAIEANLAAISERVYHISSIVNNVDDRVIQVDGKVDNFYSEFINLRDEFEEFVGESRRIAALADAKQSIMILKQEIEENFGYYDEVRRHTVGILNANDVGIVRKETMANATEELMMKAPRYWLAPALIALSAWISDDRELAEKALKEAIRRDDEKTSLLFCLISRRAGKFNGALTWLDRYFSMQDPSKMERRIVVVLDAFASGLFGPDAKGLCSEKIAFWIDELSSKSGFIENQREQWSNALYDQIVDLDDKEYPLLQEYSETWPKLKEVINWAYSHEDIYDYFYDIFNAEVKNVAMISDKIDEILDNLVNNYDNEELPKRALLRKNELIVEEEGDTETAEERFDSEFQAYEEYSDFSEHLTNIALFPEATGALVATQKLAVSLSKDWIIDAYTDLTAKSRAEVPTNIDIRIKDWHGVTQDGSNEEELVQSLTEHINRERTYELSKKKWIPASITVGVIAVIAAFLLSNLHIIASVVVLGLAGYKIYKLNKDYKDSINKINREYDEYLEKSLTVLRGILAEVVDYRSFYAEKDSDYNRVIDFLNSISSATLTN
ncbi:hypothetical protein [uncultured Brachyspira sp.]|uniref:hypothetical protein n=1 Tax=uncultured Brachyspira sp. TaxID=221953 RepID=UPI0026240F9E|nr:hypothetical protein [uncultured Brachyspira sp.]